MEIVGPIAVVRPVEEVDLEAVFALLVENGQSALVRFGGRLPRFAQFAAHAWDDVLCQWLVIDPHYDRLLGVVHIASPNFEDGVAWLSAVRSRSVVRSVGESLAFMSGVLLVMNYVWDTWPLRIVSMETTSSAYAQFASGAGKYFEVEGRLRDRRFRNGRYEDVLILSITRERWVAVRNRHARYEGALGE